MLRYDYDSMSPEELRSIFRRGEASLVDATKVAKPIVEAVRRGGDRALLRYARKFEGFRGRSLRVSDRDMEAASSRMSSSMLRSLRMSRDRILAYHKRQRLDAFEYKDGCGIFGQKVLPLQRIGIYVPGGTAAYASSVLMAALPAKVAGVDEVVMCTPSKGGRVNDTVLTAARIAGVDEVISTGGAQGIAAMAYGTESIRPVMKIVGPGGSIVSAAKGLVRVDCEIDSIAGPSEVLIIADGSAHPDLVASEMIAQLEHDPSAVAVLVSPSGRLLDQVGQLMEQQISNASRRDVLEQSSVSGAVLIGVPSLAKAVQFSNDYAPEHLVIDTKDPRSLFGRVRNAGSVFLGGMSSVAFGDYCSGPNHVLPTMGTAKARSCLSVYDFVKILPYQELTARGAASLAPATAQLAEAEGLPNHAVAARLRSGGAD